MVSDLPLPSFEVRGTICWQTKHQICVRQRRQTKTARLLSASWCCAALQASRQPHITRTATPNTAFKASAAALPQHAAGPRPAARKAPKTEQGGIEVAAKANKIPIPNLILSLLSLLTQSEYVMAHRQYLHSPLDADFRLDFLDLSKHLWSSAKLLESPHRFLPLAT